MNKPIVFETRHRIRFTELDPYDHVGTAAYAAYFVDHRMQGIREVLGWDLRTLAEMPVMFWTRHLAIDFLRPARGDDEVTIRSWVRDFRGPDAFVDCTMTDDAHRGLARCVMTVACVDRATKRAVPWTVEHMEPFFERAA